MDTSALDIVIFAPLAPILGVLLFWLVQMLFIESEKYLLGQIKPRHEALCRFTNFLGILFQSISHALGFTVTRSGVSEFFISVNYGKVAPKKEKTGIFEWIANGFLFMGPFFVPAFLILICLFFLMSGGFDVSVPANIENIKYTFSGQLNILGASLSSFLTSFIGFISNIDLFHPGHLGFLILFVFLGMGIRPSYIGEKKREKVDILYDLKNVGDLVRQKPQYVLVLFLVCYIIFYLSVFLNQLWYVTLFSFFCWLSIVSIMAIIVSDLLLLEIKATDEIIGKWKYIPFFVLPLSYVLMRIFFYFISFEYALTISILAMLFFTWLVTFLLLRSKSDRFKTKNNIKKLRKKRKKEEEGENDG